MAFPDSFLPDEIPTTAAGELLELLEGCPVSRGLRTWLASLHGEVLACEQQAPMFNDAA